MLQIYINTGGSTACVDGALANNPTCGWATTVGGARIANSQGFCCSCSLAQLTTGSTQRKSQSSAAWARKAEGAWVGYPLLHFDKARDGDDGLGGLGEQPSFRVSN